MSVFSPRDLMLRWVREREAVRIAKEAGKPFPWTADKVISEYRFCNVRREDDSVTIWIRENIRERFRRNPALWFMLCAARQINWPESLKSLIDDYSNAWPDKSGFTPRAMGIAMTDMANRGKKVFTGAYNITAPPVKGTRKTDWVAHHTLGRLWGERVTIERLWDRGSQPSMKRVHAAIMNFDCWGPFMAYQAVVDMRFTRLLENAPDREDWAAAGPGTLRGLNRLAGRPLDKKITQDLARIEMLRLHPLLMASTGVAMDFSDVPNVLCETDKYIRLINGEGTVRAKYVPGRGS